MPHELTQRFQNRIRFNLCARENLVLIAATNIKEYLDPAILSRFRNVIHIDLPLPVPGGPSKSMNPPAFIPYLEYACGFLSGYIKSLLIAAFASSKPIISSTISKR